VCVGVCKCVRVGGESEGCVMCADCLRHTIQHFFIINTQANSVREQIMDLAVEKVEQAGYSAIRSRIAQNLFFRSSWW